MENPATALAKGAQRALSFLKVMPTQPTAVCRPESYYAKSRRDNLNLYFQDAIRTYWNQPALSDYDGATLAYRDVARRIAKLHILFEKAGIKRGDKIALIGRNSSAWAVVFLATLTYGAISVPILHEFKSDNMHHLINHSEARLLFVDKAIFQNLDPARLTRLEGIIDISDFSLITTSNPQVEAAREHLNELFGQRYPMRFTPEDVKYVVDDPDDIALISYTSGSTGFSKGVMVTFGNLWSNIQYIRDGLPTRPGDGVVMMLPMAHMYGLCIDLLHPFCAGNHIYFLTRTPSPRIIMEAFARIKPRIVVTVPLIIEKIIKTRVFPLLEKPMMKMLMHVPYLDDRLMAKIKDRLTETFGGNIEEIIIGGAALNKEVEGFLKKIGFPYTVGYGMTECAPLIAYEHWDLNRLYSCGKKVERMEVKIDSPDPEKIPGVLYVRGNNVMKGYYKNQEATDKVIDKDGWMSTGDICTMDRDGYIYIKGRDKNMILGPSGQNIYPEEIEEKLNNMPYVAESLVIDSGQGRLRALIYPDVDNAASQGITGQALIDLMHENVKLLNQELPAYSQISSTKIYDEEFEKTPKRSIKRYLYQV